MEKLKEFELTYRPNVDFFAGVYVFIEKGELCEKVKVAFGREKQDLCLKVFRNPFVGDSFKDYLWGNDFCPDDHISSLFDSSMAQNVASWIGLAPRVYGIVVIKYKGKKYLAQLTDYVEGEILTDKDKKFEVYEKLKAYLSSYDFLPPARDLIPDNVIDGKWLDFQGAKPKDNYKDLLLPRLKDNAYFVKGTHYQTQPEIGLKGFRNSEQRVKNLKLDKIDFNDKTVLDIGCCGGFFCNYVSDMGAKRVIGVDIPRNAEISRELSNYLGNFNVDYVSKEIGKNEFISDFLGINSFDIVLYLAVNWYLGFPDWLFHFVKDKMIVEKNGKEDGITDEFVKDLLKDKFKKVERIGKRTDFDNQPIFLCQN